MRKPSRAMKIFSLHLGGGHTVYTCKVTDQSTVNFTMYNVYFNEVHKTLNMINFGLLGGYGGPSQVNRGIFWALPPGSGCAAGCASCECCEWDVDPSLGHPSPGLMALSLSTAQQQRFLQRFSLSWPLLANNMPCCWLNFHFFDERWGWTSEGWLLAIFVFLFRASCFLGPSSTNHLSANQKRKIYFWQASISKGSLFCSKILFFLLCFSQDVFRGYFFGNDKNNNYKWN